MKISKTIFLTVLLALLLCSISSVASAYTYNREAAATYAYNNALKDVPNSAYFQNAGGDCTNFASHCLKAGGWVYSVDKYVPTYKAYKSDLSWYFYSTSPGCKSYSWGGAQNMYNFLSKSGRATAVSVTYNLGKLEKGDIIQSDTGVNGKFNGWDHTMVVSDKRNGILYLSYHNDNVRDISFDAMKAKMESQANGQPVRYIGWHIKDTYSNSYSY
ncbi:MAG: amidase domain-containing protein [Candidatus Pacebacteria bacterium]|nr:amidase domain-containing protein [Candidatus Paceibacterota bacterium]